MTNSTHEISRDFLLCSQDQEKTNRYAVKLYEGVRDLPIIDPHTHLVPRDIASNRRFENVSRLLLKDGREGDHYVWSLMGRAGVDEYYITGEASDQARFMAFAEVFPLMRDNPVYHWTSMVLQNLFNVDEELNKDNAEDIWNRCNSRLQQDGFSMCDLLKRMKVEVVCTTDDPCDSLEDHRNYLEKPGGFTRMLPTWRPDNAFEIEKSGYVDWVTKLAGCSRLEITGLDSLIAALRRRHDFFASLGCVASDHGIDCFYSDSFSDSQADAAIKKRLRGDALDPVEISRYKSAMLYHGALMDSEKDWVQQFHVGPRRNTSTWLQERHGPNAGGDAMGNETDIVRCESFLNKLQSEGVLGKVIIYPINPNDITKTEVMIGRFNRGIAAGDLFVGVPWWFNDHDAGLFSYFESVRCQSLLSRIPGMVSDSRSAVSAYRFDYFRRVLCRFIAELMGQGYPPLGTPEGIEERIKDLKKICYTNAKEYFGV